jgi:hypothetical protein
MTLLQDWSLGPTFAGSRENFPLLRHVVTNETPPDSYALEFGVAEGTSLAIIAEHMPAVGFDSFLGLPEQWGPYPVGSRACMPPTIPNTQLVIGMFDDTLPGFEFGNVDPIGLVHFDADLYSSTVTILDWVGPWLGDGACLVFDEWHGNPWHADHEEKAWREYALQTGIAWDVIGHDNEAWAIRIKDIGHG